jgi:hypothetical protein
MAPATFPNVEDVVTWIDQHVLDSGDLTDTDNFRLRKIVEANESPLIIFWDPKHNWIIALDEPNKTPFDCFWFVSGMFTMGEAKRTLLHIFQDHTKVRVIGRMQLKGN